MGSRKYERNRRVIVQDIEKVDIEAKPLYVFTERGSDLNTSL